MYLYLKEYCPIKIMPWVNQELYRKCNGFSETQELEHRGCKMSMEIFSIVHCTKFQ